MNNTAKTVAMIVIGVLMLVGLFGMCSSIGSSSSSYEDDLRNGVQKAYTGEEMTKDEYNAANNFFEWKEEQGTKTYNDWDD